MTVCGTVGPGAGLCLGKISEWIIPNSTSMFLLELIFNGCPV